MCKSLGQVHRRYKQRKKISIAAYCESCKSNDKYQDEVMKEIRELKHKLETQDDATQRYFVTQKDVIHKLTGNIDKLEKKR